MDPSVWIARAQGVSGNDPATTGLVIGILSAAAGCSLPGVASILLARRSESPRLAILLQVPVVIIGLTLALVGVALFLPQKSPPLALGLLAGGGLAVLESCAYILVAVAIWRQKQRRSLFGKPTSVVASTFWRRQERDHRTRDSDRRRPDRSPDD
jgi:Ca2+/Na+ antiporter